MIRQFIEKPFPFFYKKDSDNLIFSLGIGLFTYTFLIIYEPFDFNEWDGRYIHSIYYSLIGITIFSTNISFFKYGIPRLFKIKKQNTISYYLGFMLWNTFVVCILITIFNYLFIEKYQNNLLACIQSSTIKVAYMSILHILLTTGFLRNLQLRQKIKKADILAPFKESITIQADTKETLTINPDDFLFAQAQDNYTLIYWQKDEKVNQHLMRITLKKLEAQLAGSTLQRCHRSYVVNLNKVVHTEGNINKMHLKLAPTEHRIPVSRSLGKKFKQSLNKTA